MAKHIALALLLVWLTWGSLSLQAFGDDGGGGDALQEEPATEVSYVP